MNKLDHALSLAAKGFKVFPIAAGKKAPPLLNGWPQKATSNPDDVRSYWLAVPDANIGIHCEGMIVIDVDVKKGGDESLTTLEMIYGLPDTLVARTPTGGRHIYLRHPDAVANGVDVLARGLDIRSEGGYVVAPGSTVESGDYKVETDAAIAAAPAWLVQKLGTFTKREQSEKVNIPDASKECVDRAAEWLKNQAPATQGDGGDARTFVVACGLRDLGVSENQAQSLMQDWNQWCSPPWSGDDLWVKVRNAYHYAENAPGSKAALPEDFPLVIPKVGIEKPIQGLLTLSQFANKESHGLGYVIKGLLQRGSYAEVYGAPGEGKTFVALDMAYHVAAATAWMDRKVHGGPVLYLAYEGIGGLVRRAQALRQQYGDADVPLYVTGASLSLREPKGRQELGVLLALLPSKPVLIVIDTFARALMGGDENSAQDVGAFNSAIAALIENTGACVCIVHHSGKDASKGARGSSALLGALDTEIQVASRTVVSTKQRDIEIAPPIGFKLVPLTVGIDADGDELTSCVVMPDAVKKNGQRIMGNAKRGFDVLCGIRVNNDPVTQEEWREACLSFLNPKTAKQRFFDLKKQLMQKGYVVADTEGLITRRCD